MSGRVLVIDDEADIRDTIIEVLTDEGFEAVGAENGARTLELLTVDLEAGRPLPHAILLDLRMPVLDGEGFRREQLKDPRLAKIPVVIVSANARVREVAEELGVAEHLRKPIDLDALIETIRRHARA